MSLSDKVAEMYRVSNTFQQYVHNAQEEARAPLLRQIQHQDQLYFNLQQEAQTLRDQAVALQARCDRMDLEIDKLQQNSAIGAPHPIPSFRGDYRDWELFSQSLWLKFLSYPQHFTSHRMKAMYMLECMRGPAASWASLFSRTASLPHPAAELDNFSLIFSQATLAFGSDEKNIALSRELVELIMPNNTKIAFETYDSKFDRLCRVVTWSEPVLMHKYMTGLDPSLCDWALLRDPASSLPYLKRSVLRIVNDY